MRTPIVPVAPLLLLSSQALAAPTSGAVTAWRVNDSIVLDGKLSENVWSEITPYTDFIQLFPEEGARPTERSELWVLYNDDYVYVGMRCHDSQPGMINRRLGRRDNTPFSDSVDVYVDFKHDHRTGLYFGVNAAGVQVDGVLYADNKINIDWDGVWDAATSIEGDGWSVEMAIPRTLMGAGDISRWGFLVKRSIARKHEDISSIFIPRSANGHVSLFGHLEAAPEGGTRFPTEWLPYVAARGTRRPQFSDPARPAPRLTDPSLDVGLDFRAGLGGGFQLNATLNPDFGQVEADQILLNVTNQELFFPEKRPFFYQDTDIFQPVGADSSGQAPHMLFYSRRIGLDTPILGAAKLTGTVGKRLEVGLLDAFVTNAALAAADEENPDRRFEFYPRRPLHFAPNNEVAQLQAVSQNFLTGVLQYKLGESSTVGTRFASGVPLTPVCTEADQQSMSPPPGCSVLGGNTGAVDISLRSSGSRWAILGQVEGSQTVGGAPVRILRDGTRLGRGDTGWGGYVQTGKLGGQPLRFDLFYGYTSPTLELNAVGFLPTQNQQEAASRLTFIRPTGGGPFRRYSSWLSGRSRWSTDGRAIERGRNVEVGGEIQLPTYDRLTLMAGYDDWSFDIREIGSTGIPFQRLPDFYSVLQYNGNGARILTFNGFLFLQRQAAPGRHQMFVEGNVGMTFYPGSQAVTSLNVSNQNQPQGPRFIRPRRGVPIDPMDLRFGDLTTRTLSATLRQLFVATPRLTFQAYAQLFVAQGKYGQVYRGSAPMGASVRVAELQPLPDEQRGFHVAQLNMNLVARWEYRLGSTLFLVYTHSNENAPVASDRPLPTSLAPAGLMAGPATDSLMLKWSYWWAN
jgi:hypothetical protein